MYTPACRYYTVVQVVHDSASAIEYTVVHWVQLWCKLYNLCRHTSCTNTPIDHKTVFQNYVLCRIDTHALLMSNFEYTVLSIDPTTVQRCAQENWICIATKNRRREPGRDGKILSDTGCYALRVLLNFRSSTCVHRPLRSAAQQFRTQGSAYRTYHYSMYVCMVITYSRVWINRVRLPILLVVS